MTHTSEFIERHDAKVVLGANQEPVPVTAAVIWDAPKEADYIALVPASTV